MVVWASDSGLVSAIASPSLFAYPLRYTVACKAFASPHAKGNKKAQSYHTHVTLGNGRLRFQ